MNRICNIWIEGLKILGRFVVFAFIIGVLSLPVQFLLQGLISILGENNGMNGILSVVIFIAVYPIIFWLAADFTGHFKEKRKKNSKESSSNTDDSQQSKAEPVATGQRR